MGRGEAVVIGEEGPVAVPVPEGWPYVARIDWIKPGQARVVDGADRQYLLTATEPVEIHSDPIRLKIEVVHQFRLRRLPMLATAMSSLAGLFIIGQLILSLGLVTGQGVQSCEVYCGTWLGHYSQIGDRGAWQTPLSISDRICQCPTPEMAGNAGGAAAQNLVAEYLDRLLKNDLDGHDDGVIVRKERPTGYRANESFFMPAGDKGPATKMGGASETALRPDRTYSDPETAPESHKSQEMLSNEEVGTPVNLPGQDDELVSDAEDPKDGEGEPLKPAAEEEEGWGVRDWYDAEDQVRDEMEIEAMTRLAKRILKINPNDPEALSILSYYQYLSEDYDAAGATYDTYIATLPNDPAGYNNKALIYKRQKNYAAEERLYRVALELQPDDPTALNNLAVNLGHQGRIEEALAIMKGLETATPDDPYADLHRAKIYAEAQQEAEAYVHLERALDGMKRLDTLHHIEFRQDIRLDPSFKTLRKQPRFRTLMWRYYGTDAAEMTQP
jgi:regulator of sirC expression with transglutaminase-like and TPR domain